MGTGMSNGDGQPGRGGSLGQPFAAIKGVIHTFPTREESKKKSLAAAVLAWIAVLVILYCCVIAAPCDMTCYWTVPNILKGVKA